MSDLQLKNVLKWTFLLFPIHPSSFDWNDKGAIFFTNLLPGFFHLLLKPRTYLNVCLNNGVDRILSYLQRRGWDSNLCQFSSTSFEGP